jgi:hypothetical protein
MCYTKHLIEISLRMYKRGQQFDGRATYSSRDKMKPFTQQGANAGSGERLLEGGAALGESADL